MRFSGKTVLITGASSGIGQATAVAFAKAGAMVIINYHTNLDGALATQRRIEEASGRCVIMPADVTDRDAFSAAVQKIAETMPVDIAICNAGITRDRTALKLAGVDWDAVIATNLTGVFNTVQAVLPGMVERKSGAIVCVASVIGHSGNIGQANYGASKAGIMGMVRCVAREVARKGVRINVVAPGFIGTPMVEAIPADVLDSIKSATAMGRLGTPDEVADSIMFLASEQASFITGNVLDVNGGYYFH